MVIAFHLFLTLALELLIYGLVHKFYWKPLLAMLISNIILNLTMNFLAVSIDSKNQYMIFIISFEIFTFISEAFVLFLFSNKKLWFCFLICFCANILSLSIGYVFNYFSLINKNEVVIPSLVICGILISLEIILSVILFLIPLYRRLNDKGDEGGEDNNAEADK